MRFDGYAAAPVATARGGAARASVTGIPALLTHREAAQLLAAMDGARQTASVSLDLGRTQSVVALTAGMASTGAVAVSRQALTRIAGDENKCFEIVGGQPVPISVFSATTGWARSLFPTEDAPTTLVAGFPMHRIRGTTPLADTEAKVRALGRPRGRVLDTATGLGYTAIALAKTATLVVTVELDPAAIALARRNPWSAALFENDNIKMAIGDVAALAAGFPAGAFSAVLHDPPTSQLAGALYSGAFYAEVRRVLKPGGRLYHYVGDPRSSQGAKTAAGVSRRLRAAGFRNVRTSDQAFGVTAMAGGGRLSGRAAGQVERHR